MQECTILTYKSVQYCIAKVYTFISVDYQLITGGLSCEVIEIVHVPQCLFVLIFFLFTFLLSNLSVIYIKWSLEGGFLVLYNWICSN